MCCAIVMREFKQIKQIKQMTGKARIRGGKYPLKFKLCH